MTTEENKSSPPAVDAHTEREIDQAVKDYAYDIDALADEPTD